MLILPLLYRTLKKKKIFLKYRKSWDSKANASQSIGNNEVVLEFYENGELDGDSDTISSEAFLKIAVEQGFEINNTKTKIRIDDVEYIKFSGIVEKTLDNCYITRRSKWNLDF